MDDETPMAGEAASLQQDEGSDFVSYTPLEWTPILVEGSISTDHEDLTCHKPYSDASSDAILKAVNTLVEVIQKRLEASLLSASNPLPLTPVVNAFSMTACMKVLHEMEGVDQRSKAVYKAIATLTTTVHWREAFMCMLPDQRIGWLESLDSP